MKDTRLILIISVSIILSFSNCKKWVVDYRNKWIGNYTFIYTSHIWDRYNWQTKTENFDGKIYYEPLNSLSKVIIIKFNNGTKFNAIVDKAGNLKKYDCADIHRVDINGSITTNEIYFTAIISGKPPSDYTVTGTRQ